MPAYRTASTPVLPPVQAPEPDGTKTLPALRGLKDLADQRPVLVIDSREQQPLVFTRFVSVKGTLVAGDYAIRGLESQFAVERKSIDDLANCCMGGNRERFERELHRLRGYQFKRLLIIGNRDDLAAGRYHSKIAPASVLASLNTFEVRHAIPVVFAGTPEAGARLIEQWAWIYCCEIAKNANDLLRGCQLPTPPLAPRQ
jgi:DNA excision repair protein ERCC-4